MNERNELLTRERPAGKEVRSLRMLVGLSPKELATLLHITKQNVQDYETEKNGVRMPYATWLLMRITCNAVARALWAKRVAPIIITASRYIAHKEREKGAGAGF